MQEFPAAEESGGPIRSHLTGLAIRRETAVDERRNWRWWGFLLFTLAVGGIALWWYVVRPVQRNLHLRASLSQFGLLYRAYQTDHGRSPRGLREFEDYVLAKSSGRLSRECEMTRPALEMAREGRLNVVWNAWIFWGGGAGEYLAIESDIALNGGLVLWTNSSTEYFSASDFARRTLRPIQSYDK